MHGLKPIMADVVFVTFRIGQGIVCLGLAIEVVAFAAMKWYELRRRLPVASPLHLQSTGCACFYLGLAVMILSQLAGQ